MRGLLSCLALVIGPRLGGSNWACVPGCYWALPEGGVQRAANTGCEGALPCSSAEQWLPAAHSPAPKHCVQCKHLFSSGCNECNALGRCHSCSQGFVLSNSACKKVG